MSTGRGSRRDSTSRPFSAGAPFVGPVVAAVALALYAATACPTVPFGDGGELIAASHRLGVAHPPGYPLYTVLGWLALVVPLGEPALRMNLMSAVFGALACGAVARLVRRWTGSSVAGGGAGLALAVCAAFWSVATVAEVYTLHLLLTVLMLDAATTAGGAADARDRSRGVIVAAVALGLGLAHHPTIVLAVPAGLVLAWRGSIPSRGAGTARVPRAAWAAALVLVVGLPAILDLSLVARALLHPGLEWGRPETLAALWRHVSAAQYGAYVLGLPGLARPDAWRRAVALLAGGFAWFAPVLALAGIVAWRGTGLARPGRVPAFAAALLVLAGTLFSLAYDTEDVEVFLLPACLGIVLAAGLGIAWLGSSGRASGRVLALLAAAAAVGAPAVVNFQRHDLRGVDGAAAYGRDVLAAVPRAGVLFVDGDDAFILAYLTEVLGERPDVTVYDRGGRMFHDLVAERAPAPRVLDRIGAEMALVAEEAARATPRPILFMSWPGYDLPAGMRFEPVGLLYRVRRGTEPPQADAALWAGYREEAVVRQAQRIGGFFPLAVAASYPLMRGERALYLGDRAAAAAAFDGAARLAGSNESVLNRIGTIYGRLGDYARAIVALEAATRAKPVSTRAWSNLGLARSLAGDRAGALAAWRRSLAIDPGQQDAAAAVRALEEGAGGR